MRRVSPPIVEYVVSDMVLEDEYGNFAVGVLVSPRYKNETDERFCGRNGALDVRIACSIGDKSDACEAAMRIFRIHQEGAMKVENKQKKKVIKRLRDIDLVVDLAEEDDVELGSAG